MTLNPDWSSLCSTNTISKEEYAKVIEHLREGRRAAAELSQLKRAQAGKKKRKKTAEPPIEEPPK